MREIISNILHLEFENKIDDIINEKLYSNSGYLNLKSKEAIEKIQIFLDEFDYEIQKLVDEIKIENFKEIVEEKKSQFEAELEKHYIKQTKVWAQEIFEKTIENILFKVSINKNNKEKRQVLYSKALSVVSWIVNVLNLDSAEQKSLIETLNKKYILAIKSDFREFTPKQNAKKSDPAKFLFLLNLFRSKKEEFLKRNLEEDISFLSLEDFNYLKILKNSLLRQSQNMFFDDEIDLFYSAFEILNLTDDKEKYELMSQIKFDFQNQKKKNENLDEKEKIEIAKRRIEIFKDSKENKNFKSQKSAKGLRYFKKALSS